MSDIHGCFDELQAMFKKVELSKQDTLIIAGDYIDRGQQNYEMLEWIESSPKNVIFLCGNHDIEFAGNVELLNQYADEDMDIESNEETKNLYDSFRQLISEKNRVFFAFDYYGTLGKLINEDGATLKQLLVWTDCIWDMPYYHITEVNNKKYVIVHAGYTENLDSRSMYSHYDSLEDFYIYAREDAYINGGIENGTIIAGHTPTIIDDELPYNKGDVYKFYNKKMNCTFYDIDCGCAYKTYYPDAKLACIRLEDEKIFYV